MEGFSSTFYLHSFPRVMFYYLILCATFAAIVWIVQKWWDNVTRLRHIPTPVSPLLVCHCIFSTPQ